MKAILAVGFVALLALASAQTSVNAGGICPGCASNSDLLWVGTLNTQQIPTASRYRDQRLRATVDYLNTDSLVANFDAMCLQELWAPSRKNFVTSGVNQRFPYSYTTSSFEVADCDFNCTSGISNLDNCFSDDCFNSVSDIFSDNAWNCLSDTCSDAFDNLDINCQICVTSQDNSNMKAGMQSCRSATSNLINTAGTCTYLFGGESDNVLLSAHPLIETNYLLFSNSPYVASTVIHGKFQKGTSTVNMFCTHLLPANISPGNFESVNRAQVQQLIQFVNNNTAPGEFVVIAGDFNNGPELANIDGEWENNFRLMETNGFQSTFVTLANPPTCSYCANGGNYLASNPVGPDDNRDILIDHVFIRNGSACAASTGLFATQNIVDVGNRNVPISDHYGVFGAYCLGSTASPAPTVAPSGVPTIVPSVVPTASPIIIAPSPAQEGAAGIVTPVLAAVGVLAAIILYS